MRSEFVNLVVQTDEESSVTLAKTFRSLPDTRVQEQKIEALTGDPNTWVLVAQAAAAAVTAAAPIIVALISKGKKIVINGVVFENVSDTTVERILKAMHDGDRSK